MLFITKQDDNLIGYYCQRYRLCAGWEIEFRLPGTAAD